jgi:hypothetical protein
MFNEEDYPTERTELMAWAAAAVVRAYEWPAVPTQMFGLILLSRQIGPELPRFPLYRERLFMGQCPKTLLMHVETHVEMKAPALADFARRAIETIEAHRAEAETPPTLLKSQRHTSNDLFTWVSRSDAGKSASIKRFIESSIEPLPRLSRAKKR